MSDIQILNKKTLSCTKYLLEEITFTHTNLKGEKQTSTWEIYHRNSAATILLYDQERRMILLAEQLRLPVYLKDHNGYLLETCAGMIDKDELPEHSIIREVEEELGYRISEIEKIAEAHLSPAAITEYIYFFLGKYSPDMKVSDGGGKENEGEDIRIVEMSFEEAREKLVKGEINDVKTILLLQHALIRGII
jgi:nudix-type nucleoside diphosphatase (YffH/AdpP family)